jgi:hypothetical protein
VGFLIDTNLLIAIERGRLSAADIHAITKQAPISVFRICGSRRKRSSATSRC